MVWTILLTHKETQFSSIKSIIKSCMSLHGTMRLVGDPLLSMPAEWDQRFRFPTPKSHKGLFPVIT